MGGQGGRNRPVLARRSVHAAVGRFRRQHIRQAAGAAGRSKDALTRLRMVFAEAIPRNGSAVASRLQARPPNSARRAVTVVGSVTNGTTRTTVDTHEFKVAIT